MFELNIVLHIFASYYFDSDQRDSVTMEKLFVSVIVGLCKLALSFLREAYTVYILFW